MDEEAPLEICDREDVQVLSDVQAMRSYLAEHPEVVASMLAGVPAAHKESREHLAQLFGQPAFA